MTLTLDDLKKSIKDKTLDFPPTEGSKPHIQIRAQVRVKHGIDELMQIMTPETDPLCVTRVFFCFHQLAEGKGFSRDNALQDIGISALYKAMRMLKYSLSMQLIAGKTEDRFLDLMVMKHNIENHVAHLYNWVDKPCVDSELN